LIANEFSSRPQPHSSPLMGSKGEAVPVNWRRIGIDRRTGMDSESVVAARRARRAVRMKAMVRGNGSRMCERKKKRRRAWIM
jgi:hypothetical protein